MGIFVGLISHTYFIQLTWNLNDKWCQPYTMSLYNSKYRTLFERFCLWVSDTLRSQRLSSKSKAWDFSLTSLEDTYGFLPISTPSGDWLPSFLLVNSSPKHTHANTQTYTCTPHCLPGQSRVEYSHMALSPWPSQLVKWLELGQSQCSIPQGTKCGLKPGRQIKLVLRFSVAISGINDRT